MDIKSSSSVLGASESTGQALNIVTTSDEHYAQHLSVMLLSLFENNRNHAVKVFIIVPEDMKEYILTRIRSSVPKVAKHLHFCNMQQGIVEDLKGFRHFTIATYYRLLIGELLPQDINRVIYLDPDIIVRGDIGELWNAYLGDSAVGAVPDLLHTPQRKRQIVEKLGLHPDAPYFNAGVLLVDLDRWRESRVGLDALDFARSHLDRITHADQCALNWVLRDRWTPLPDRWNLQTNMIALPREALMHCYSREAKRLARAAKIVHFAGRSKPWYYMNNHPLKREYLTYLSRTEWKSYKFPDYSLRNFIRKNVYRFAPFMLRTHLMMRERFPIWRRMW
jgi:lipopolysaccharide biosynthesis glycosyltransferase